MPGPGPFNRTLTNRWLTLGIKNKRTVNYPPQMAVSEKYPFPCGSKLRQGTKTLISDGRRTQPQPRWQTWLQKASALEVLCSIVGGIFAHIATVHPLLHRGGPVTASAIGHGSPAAANKTSIHPACKRFSVYVIERLTVAIMG